MWAKEDESSTGCIWAAGFHHVMAHSRLEGVLKHTNHLLREPRITETTDTESADTGDDCICFKLALLFTSHPLYMYINELLLSC
jgi:hypothetical protein